MNQGYPRIMIKPDINLFFKNILSNKSGRSMTYLLQNYVFTKTELKSLLSANFENLKILGKDSLKSQNSQKVHQKLHY